MDGSYIIEHYSCCALTPKLKLDYLCTHVDPPSGQAQACSWHIHTETHVFKMLHANIVKYTNTLNLTYMEFTHKTEARVCSTVSL